MKSSRFVESDCWILYSIGFSQKGRTLRDIIAAGDMLNHAIIERNEMQDGLNRLIGGGFIQSDNGYFFVTHKAIEFYNQNKKPNEGCIEEWMRVANIFVKLEVEHPIFSVHISEEEYRQAYEEYRSIFARLVKAPFRRLRGKGRRQ